MPVRRFGLVSQDPPGTATRQLRTLPWADATTPTARAGSLMPPGWRTASGAYQTVDPRLSHVDELWRERPDGTTEFVARFWYLPKS